MKRTMPIRRSASLGRLYGTSILPEQLRRPYIACRIFPAFRDSLFTRSRSLTTTARAHHSELAGSRLDAPGCNVSSTIAAKVGRKLHRQRNHPLQILLAHINDYFASFVKFDDLSPIVSTHANFESLNIPIDHVSRSYSDTYYLNCDTVLRPHTSCHQVELLRQGHTQFLVAGDVYRRDEIDQTHYPVFHQCEGVQLMPNCSAQIIQDDLQQTLQGLATHLFGDVEQRWVEAYFPFTHPSLELEIYYQGDWLEVLGCGVIHPQILRHAGLDPDASPGWAFGLGLERLAMVLFDIPDIRLFWTTDARFHDQFASGSINIKFQPYSKFPPVHKDISFWLPAPPAAVSGSENTTFHANDLHEVVRGVGGDLIEAVQLVDNFVHPKTRRASHCYRISYRSMDRNLTNAEIDALQEQVRGELARQLRVELR